MSFRPVPSLMMICSLCLAGYFYLDQWFGESTDTSSPLTPTSVQNNINYTPLEQHIWAHKQWLSNSSLYSPQGYEWLTKAISFLPEQIPNSEWLRIKFLMLHSAPEPESVFTALRNFYLFTLHVTRESGSMYDRALQIQWFGEKNAPRLFADVNHTYEYQNALLKIYQNQTLSFQEQQNQINELRAHYYHLNRHE